MKNFAEYTASADIYDHMMKDIDYAGWCDYIQDLSYEFLFSIDSVQDISCGTGTLLNAFPSRIKRGSDLSEPMIRKAGKKYPHIPFKVASMLSPEDCGADCILNIHDALNYLPELSQVGEHLKYMRQRLRDDQVYIFDFAMEAVARNHFSGVIQEGVTAEGIRYTRENHFEDHSRRFITNLNIIYPDGRQVSETHTQYFWSFEEIKNLCMEISPNRIIFLEEFTFTPAGENSERLLVIML